MNIQDILDDLDAGEHIPNNVVRELCNRLKEYDIGYKWYQFYTGGCHEDGKSYLKKIYGDWKINNG